MHLILNDSPQGYWLCCDVKGLEGDSIIVSIDTTIEIRLLDGRMLKSSRIIATVDPCGFDLLDNQQAPFILSERIFGYDADGDGLKDGVRLYVRFSAWFVVGDIADWRWVLLPDKHSQFNPPIGRLAAKQAQRQGRRQHVS